MGRVGRGGGSGLLLERLTRLGAGSRMAGRGEQRYEAEAHRGTNGMEALVPVKKSTPTVVLKTFSKMVTSFNQAR